MSTLTTYTTNKNTPFKTGLRAGVAVLFLSVFVTACGGGKTDNSLAGKKEELAKLKGESKTLTEKIAKLDAEIKAADPSMKAAEKVFPVITEVLQTRSFKSFIEIQGTVETKNTATATPRMAGTYTRIKPKTTLLAGDSVTNKAYIYFDFNAPVETNTAVTKIILPTSINELAKSSGQLAIFPNPAKDELIFNSITQKQTT